MHKHITLSHYTLLSLLYVFSSITSAEPSTSNRMAGTTGPSLEYVFGLAVTAGGDDLATVDLLYNDGSVESETIEAGGLVYFYGGIQLDTPAFPIRLTLGYFTDSINASNGSISFTRIPFEVTGLYTSGQHTFGLGLSYHLSPELDLTDAGGSRYSADDALGLLVMYEYELSSNYSLGLRYTDISYEFEGGKADGSNIGLLMDFKF